LKVYVKFWMKKKDHLNFPPFNLGPLDGTNTTNMVVKWKGKIIFVTCG